MPHHKSDRHYDSEKHRKKPSVASTPLWEGGIFDALGVKTMEMMVLVVQKKHKTGAFMMLFCASISPPDVPSGSSFRGQKEQVNFIYIRGKGSESNSVL